MMLKVLLLIFTMLSIIVMIWAGFTRNDALFPILLSMTTALSMANLLLDARKGKKRTVYMLAMSLSVFSIIICGVTLII